MPFNVIGFVIGQNQAEQQFTSRGKPVDSSSTQRAALLSGMLFPIGLVLAINAAARDAEAAAAPAASTGVTGATELVAVPTITGLGVGRAERTLNAFGLSLSPSPQQFFADRPVNEVLSQEPEAERPVPTGTTVTVTLSKGAPPAKGVPVAIEAELVNMARRIVQVADAQPPAEGKDIAPVPKK